MRKKAERAKVLLVEDGKKIEEYAAANNLDVQKTESGLYYVIEQEGTGPETTPGTTMYVNYAGYLLDGTIFDTSIQSLAEEKGIFSEDRPYEPLPVNVGMGQVIPGWDEGLLLLKKRIQSEVSDSFPTWLWRKWRWSPNRTQLHFGF